MRGGDNGTVEPSHPARESMLGPGDRRWFFVGAVSELRTIFWSPLLNTLMLTCLL